MVVSLVSLFPASSSPQGTNQEDFEREVAARFGLVPNFFRSAPDAPFVIRQLWGFAKSAYLDTPIPTLFKERLFVYLSRFCEVRYCVTRHCGFLLGLGRAAGDEESGRQKDLLLKELNHRVKNNLQIVSSLLHLQAKTAGTAAGQFNNAAARVAAIALVHQQLHKYDDVGTVVLDRYLIDLCQATTAASSSPDQAWSLVVDAEPLIISTDVAVPLALVVNELVTNAIQHSKPIERKRHSTYPAEVPSRHFHNKCFGPRRRPRHCQILCRSRDSNC